MQRPDCDFGRSFPIAFGPRPVPLPVADSLFPAACLSDALQIRAPYAPEPRAAAENAIPILRGAVIARTYRNCLACRCLMINAVDVSVCEFMPLYIRCV